MKYLLLLLFGVFPFLLMAEEWNSFVSSPEIMSFDYEYSFSRLPLEGKNKFPQRYWPGNYWALSKGNINRRWNKSKVRIPRHSPSFDEARKMTIPELAMLSPSEKYDLAMGDYTYSLKKEVSSIANPRAQIWEGICHGWSPASINHDEPRPKLFINPDGIEIPFGSTDIKALLSYYYAFHHKAVDTYQMGRRCFKMYSGDNDPECGQDLNAGAFHVVLANQLGLMGEGFVIDRNRFRQVWNNPIAFYKSLILSEYSPSAPHSSNVSKVILLKTTVFYVKEKGHSWTPMLPASTNHYGSTTYKYEIELNSRGEIIGGQWLSVHRPDFLWRIDRPHRFEGHLKKLNQLL